MRILQISAVGGGGAEQGMQLHPVVKFFWSKLIRFG